MTGFYMEYNTALKWSNIFASRSLFPLDPRYNVGTLYYVKFLYAHLRNTDVNFNSFFDFRNSPPFSKVDAKVTFALKKG